MTSLLINKRARDPDDIKGLDYGAEAIFEVRMLKKVIDGVTLTKAEQRDIWADKDYPEPEEDDQVDVESAELYGIREQGPL